MTFDQTVFVIAAAPPTQSLRSACTRLLLCEDRNLAVAPPPAEEALCGEALTRCSSPPVPTCTERIMCRRLPACGTPVVPALVAG
ncbi:MAG TPA: hypothetical protein VJ783_05695 [Pirellulales bacterium]|nr:hypothetical protein [Pirellulales bacterium]